MREFVCVREIKLFVCVHVRGPVCVQDRVFVCKTECARQRRGRGLGSRPKKMYGERLGDGVEYHLMKPTPRR